MARASTSAFHTTWSRRPGASSSVHARLTTGKASGAVRTSSTTKKAALADTNERTGSDGGVLLGHGASRVAARAARASCGPSRTDDWNFGTRRTVDTLRVSVRRCAGGGTSARLDVRSSSMAPVGIASKRWFYGFREALDGDAARSVFAGAAVERWLNAEIFRFLAKALPTHLTAYPEFGKKDIAILDVEDGRPRWDHRPRAFIELKLLYSNYSIEKRRLYIERLLDQLVACASRGVPGFGWVFGVYAHWPPHAPNESFGEFRQATLSQLRSAAEARGEPTCTLAKRTMETFIDAADVQIGGALAHVGVVGQYVLAGRSA